MIEDVRLIGLKDVKPYKLKEGIDLYGLEPPPMLVEEILPKQTITGVSSFPGVGKTWFAMELARAVSTGTRFLNKFQSEQGSILFVGSDASIHDYARQWRKLTVNQWSSLSPDEESPEDYRNPLDTNIKFLIGSDFMLDDLNAIRSLIRTSQVFEWGELIQTDFGVFQQSGFSLIIFDTLSKLTRAKQEDNTAMEDVFRNIRLVSEQTKAGIVILHHNSYKNEFNDGERWRGAGAQVGALDNWFQINDEKNYKIVKTKKFRGITPEPFTYSQVIDEETAKLEITDREQVNGVFLGVQTGILEFLQKTPGGWFTVKQIAVATWEDNKVLFPDFEPYSSCIRKRLNFMLDETPPVIRKTGGGKRSVRAEYSAVI